MQPARIAELLEPFLGPDEDSRRQIGELIPNISTYIDILLRWNARINLTAIRNEEEIVTRHFGESLFVASRLFPAVYREGHDFSRADYNLEKQERALAPGARARLADLGSGAGFPGLPIKLWAPEIDLTLIESNQKKATFLREVTRALTLTDVNIQNARAETLPPSRFDVVTLRAVERFAEILPAAVTLLAPSGRLALLIGSSQLVSVRSILPAVTWDPPLPVPRSDSRCLVIGAREPRT